MRARTKYPPHVFPFSDALCAWMDLCPAFHDALKLASPQRFVFLKIIYLSESPARKGDQVMGLWYLDKRNLVQGVRPFFKQDFVVGLGAPPTQFVAYVDRKTFKKHECDHVRLIDEFFKTYGDESGQRFYHHPDINKNKPWMHHYDDIADLPDTPPPLDKDELRHRAAHEKDNVVNRSSES